MGHACNKTCTICYAVHYTTTNTISLSLYPSISLSLSNSSSNASSSVRSMKNNAHVCRGDRERERAMTAIVHNQPKTDIFYMLWAWHSWNNGPHTEQRIIFFPSYYCSQMGHSRQHLLMPQDSCMSMWRFWYLRRRGYDIGKRAARIIVGIVNKWWKTTRKRIFWSIIINVNKSQLIHIY